MKIYKILIINWSNEILGAFTCEENFINTKFYTKNYDIVQGSWTKENIMVDFNLDDFNVIKHD